MATGAPSARGRNSQAAYPTLHLQAKGYSGAEWSGVPGEARLAGLMDVRVYAFLP
jgi:hypothetical protein